MTFAEDLVRVPLDGEPHIEATVTREAYEWLTGKTRGRPALVRTRWWRDDEGMVRACSIKDAAPRTEGVLVAAALLTAKDGDLIELDDPLRLLNSTMRLIEA